MKTIPDYSSPVPPKTSILAAAWSYDDESFEGYYWLIIYEGDSIEEARKVAADFLECRPKEAVRIFRTIDEAPTLRWA